MPTHLFDKPAQFIFLILCLLLPWMQAEAQDEKSVVVTSKRVNERYDIYIENRNPFDITLELNINGNNIKTSRRLPYKRVYGPESTRLALQVFVADKSKSYSINTDYTWFMGDIYARHNDSYIYRLPFRRGESYKLGQGYNGDFSHSGSSKYALDFMMPTGTTVLAAREGVVIMTHSESNRGGPSRNYQEDANFIIIRHDDGTLGEYAHLMKNGVLVEPGQKVRKGEKIGFSGNTGFSSGPHLHFMVTKVMEDGSSQSLPVRFRARRGIIRSAQEGEEYTAN